MTNPAARVTMPVVRALLDDAANKDRDHGVIAVRGAPCWDGPETFDHGGRPVRVVACESTLAVREALLDRGPDRWLVLITDREDLGTGILAHVLGQRLRTPDPWEVVLTRFQAKHLDHRLAALPATREVAGGLLAALGAGGPAGAYLPAPGGLLTIDHAFGTVSRAVLGLPGAGSRPTAVEVLAWTARPASAVALADLQGLGGAPLTTAVVAWLAGCGGPIQPFVAHALAGAGLADVVPFGLAARAVLAAPSDSGPRALLADRLAGSVDPSSRDVAGAVEQLAADAEAVVASLNATEPELARHVLARADSVLTGLRAEQYAAESDWLRRGLAARLAILGERLRASADRATTRVAAGDVDAPLVDVDQLAEAEGALARVERHQLAGRSRSVAAARAGVRVARWLATCDAPTADDLEGRVAWYRDEDSWAELASTTAWTGVSDEALAAGLNAIVGAARLRRTARDRAFAAALAAADGGDDLAGREPGRAVYPIEGVLPRLVAPLARGCAVLLVIADGMSVPVASEIITNVTEAESWLECVPADARSRRAAVAVLPTLTTYSRASLLSGHLAAGGQEEERRGFTALLTAERLTGALFHKATLDSSSGGYDLPHDVAAAIDDTTGRRLVACVLNTIDDALDKADPGGTDWTADTVRHLRPLLEAARRAGRIVVLTSDHGHVVDRRDGVPRVAGAASSSRSRPAGSGDAVGVDEVMVRGRRVLAPDGAVVLAVDERLRYGPLKAGYHGGATPAEVVVPVVVLSARGDAPAGWAYAPPPTPGWWRSPVVGSAAEHPAGEPADGVAVSDSRPWPAQGDPFEVLSAHGDAAGGDLAARVVASDLYRAQRSKVTRPGPTDAQIEDLLRALLARPDGRLDKDSAAVALGVATIYLPGALAGVQRLLNVEQYPVVATGTDGVSVVLDRQLLVEQFGVPA